MLDGRGVEDCESSGTIYGDEVYETMKVHSGGVSCCPDMFERAEYAP